ncbi:hypothetical protein Daura_41185 [Dactylosporangium aurantiacum]|uniref:Uncharacterized protein n=1 Tax=Dactylosporangium aurantiacum TaxID=35754 RepID=A0A9Q9IGH0_9ACTN|nr:hypothetical protein [Dactylosporangium aurantiacum]MDG6102805.1 hypothetical protein [Dactylosporangium aurantiacum]UWZ52954.1 hypothetical protein Daura_41185 [Dactylosporangium aurantiacum]
MTSDVSGAGDGSGEIRFTDPELAFLRHARFGELPPRVRPSDTVELVETDPRRDWPDVGPSRAQAEVQGAGG